MAVYIVGSINVDVVACRDRIPRIGESVRGTAFQRHPGGKGAVSSIPSRAGFGQLLRHRSPVRI